ncbi:MAG TPA: carboxypeptidase-like regulatory domain-containing protein [Candidatus Gastranaerophilaceae bacterium]|nr:carboxypeptidase-like regulatory domain-containing protein [Candidatus Gastranaerophilaceae bacterium]HPT41655.1 carboxypeptidase-like regulatory domain-containing protein [Candidatus Gastranaerophilaceae bacterium]
MFENLILLTVFFMLFASLPAFSESMQNKVVVKGADGINRIIDSKTNKPIGKAKIVVPQSNYQTYTDEQGRFQLGAKVDGQTVMSVEKEGYKPFSVTLDKNNNAQAIVLGIEKSTPRDIVIDTEMFHLGDNNFSDASANAREFRVNSVGPFYSKKFKLSSVPQGSSTFLVIGSIIGIDTKLAKSMGQNKITNSYASPPEIYFNGNKIAEIQLNGDGQKIKLPSSLIRQNMMNEVTIKTGRNLMQTAYVDYDDIEFMNLIIENK